MAVDYDKSELHARIVYWGPEASGKTTNLELIHRKLRSDHRGDLRSMPTRIDPSVSYEILPIELGQVSGVYTRIEIVAVPSGPDQAPTRKQLLDRVDGIVLVMDARRDRVDDNLRSFEELVAALEAYGRSIDEIPCVVQYNKRDLADPFAVEELHRKLGVDGLTAFEAVANVGTGVLQSLTTVSKLVVRALREPTPAESPAAPPVAHPPAAEPPAAVGGTSDGPPDAPSLVLISSGSPAIEAGRVLLLPLVLADSAGHEHHVEVRVEITGTRDPAP
ncbi:MAG: GTPase domain-containing protein [Myxococcales bacterium]|nr:GTPase domain-containing protein [Myxococcales bacterium]